jgi:hypothetical protein
MSVVTRWRSTPSSSVTHLSLMSGLAASKFLPSFCISIMWPLLTVAITNSVAACAPAPAKANAAASASVKGFVVMVLVSWIGCWSRRNVGVGAATIGSRNDHRVYSQCRNQYFFAAVRPGFS